MVVVRDVPTALFFYWDVLLEGERQLPFESAAAAAPMGEAPLKVTYDDSNVWILRLWWPLSEMRSIQDFNFLEK